MADWIRRELPRNASFTSDMTTTSCVMLGARRAITYDLFLAIFSAHADGGRRGTRVDLKG